MYRQTRILTPPEEQECGSLTTEAWNKIEPVSPTVTAQDHSFSSGATGIPLLLGLFVLDSLPPGWKTLCVLSSHMFLTLSRVNTYVCFKRHSTMQLDTWTLAVRYHKAYYYVEGVYSIPEVTLSSRLRVQDHLSCMIHHLVIQCYWVVESSMSFFFSRTELLH